MTARDGGRGASRGEVEAIVRRVRRTLLARAASAGVAWALALVAAGLATAWLWAGSGGWARGSRGPLLLDGALVVAVAAAAALIWSRARRFSESGVARSLDREAGLPDGTTHGSVELERRLPPGVSSALARSAGDRVLGRLPPKARRAGGSLGEVPARWLVGGVCTLVVAGSLTIFLGLRDPARARTAWAGLVNPASVLAVPEMPALRIEPASGVLPRGTPLRVLVEAPGRDRVELRWQFAGDVSRTRDGAVEGERAEFFLGPLTAPVELSARAPDGARTAVVRITPEDPFLVTDLTLQVRYPPHTGRGTERFRREAPPLALPVGSRIGIDGRASRSLSEAALRGAEADGKDEAGVDLSVSGERFSAEWRPGRSGTYAWVLRDTEGRVPEETPPPLEVAIVADSAPSVDFLFPGRDTLLPLDRRQPLVIRARDDHGLASLELVAYRVSAFGERGAPVTRELDAGGTRTALARPVLDLSGWDLLPGDTVRYRARAVDNAPRPRSARTREYVLRVARTGEMAGEVGEKLREAARAVDSLREAAGAAAEESRDLERRRAERAGEAGAGRSRSAAGAPGSRTEPEAASYQARAEVEQALERQEELLEGSDSVEQELAGLAASARDAGLADPELERDLRELRSLLEEVSRTGDRRELREMNERLDAMDSRELSDALRSVSEDQEALRERLDEALERFRRAAAEQDFRATAQQARELAREEGALAEAMEEGGERAEERAARQEELRRRAAGIEEELDSLEERLTRLGETEARSGVERARDASREAASEMASASRSARQGRPREAGESAREAAGNLRESADRMDRARNEMAQRMEQAVGETLRRTASEALALARRQSDLREEMRGAGERELARIRGDQSALLEGLRNLQGQAAGLSTMAPGVGQALAEAVGEAQDAVGRTMEAMEREGGMRRTSPSAVAQEAVGALNRLAMAVASAGQDAQGQGQGAAAGGQQLMDQLRQLARRQGGLMEQSGAVSAMELGQESLQGQLDEMAQGQDGIAGELGELARRQQDVPDDRVLGDLPSMGEEARELAERLAGGRLDAETRRRQERLFHRLLDAGRSLENDEEARERESRTAVTVERVPVEPLTEETLGGSRYALPDAALLQGLPPAQRALVIRYFERLNRESGAPPGSGGEERR